MWFPLPFFLHCKRNSQEDLNGSDCRVVMVCYRHNSTIVEPFLSDFVEAANLVPSGIGEEFLVPGQQIKSASLATKNTIME
jgi:hypothetical protein